MGQYVVNSPEQMFPVAGNILEEDRSARIFAVYGELGSGKTTLIKAMCRQLGVKDPVTSPSFPLMNEYMGAGGIRVYHFDFYRLEKLEEIYDIGYEEFLYSGHYCFIEWPGKAGNLLPGTTVKVFILLAGDRSRMVRTE